MTRATSPTRPEARDRFGLLADELRRLRSAIGEPILDLVRRIVDTTGIDVELASSVSPAAAARRENLDLFVQAVAEFQAVDGQVTLAALLAWLEAEDEFGQGLDVATPSEADSVKLLTVHRAKGLEWDAVFLVGVTERKFPTNQSRSSWLTVPFMMPNALRGDARDLPASPGTRPTTSTRSPRRPSTTSRSRSSGWATSPGPAPATCSRSRRGAGPRTSRQDSVRRTTSCGRGRPWPRGRGEPEAWRECVAKGEISPYADRSPDLPWPISHHTAEVERRLEAAARWQTAETRRRRRHRGRAPTSNASSSGTTRSSGCSTRLVRDRSPDIAVPLPSSLSATAMARLRDQPEEFARDLARPMPRRPSAAARFGTRFHAWVEARFGQQVLIDPDELPGRGDSGIDDDSDLRELIKLFEEGAFADRVPVAVEPPFALVLAGQVVRGRIDAVYADDDGGFLLVDWKTNRAQTADPLQLAIYRVAWAELHDVPLERVRAGFYYVRTGDLVEPEDLPGRAGLEVLVTGDSS